MTLIQPSPSPAASTMPQGTAEPAAEGGTASPAAGFLSALAGAARPAAEAGSGDAAMALSGKPPGAARRSAAQNADPALAVPDPSALQVPSVSMAQLAELRAGLRASLAALTEAGAAAANGSDPEAAAAQGLRQLVRALAAFDAATGANALDVAAAGMAALHASGGDRLAAAGAASAVRQAAELVAGCLQLDLAAAVPEDPTLMQGGPRSAPPTSFAAAPAFARAVAELLSAAPVGAADSAVPLETDLLATLTEDGLLRPGDPIPARTLAAAPPAPHPPRLAESVMEQMRAAGLSALRRGGETTVDLAPRGLGQLQIGVETDTAGQLRVVVRAENPLILDLLRSERPALATLLSQQGLGGSSLGFESLAGQTGQQTGQQTGRQAGSLRGGDPGGGTAATATGLPGDPASADRVAPAGTGALDILT